MTHEPKCIYPVTCTCVSILRSKIVELEDAVDLQGFIIKTRGNIIKSLENKIKDGLSCCCNNCAKHNQSLTNSESTQSQSEQEDTFPL